MVQYFNVGRVCHPDAETPRRAVMQLKPDALPFRIAVRVPADGLCERCRLPHYRIEGNSLRAIEKKLGFAHNGPRWICESSRAEEPEESNG